MDKIRDAEMWIEFALRELAEDSKSDLHRYTHIDYMSEFRGWSWGVNNIYTSPTTFEEFLIRHQIFSILLIALENALRKAECEDYSGEVDIWKIMCISEAYRVARMVAIFDPLRTPQLKVRLNRICLLARSDLNFLEQEGFYNLCIPDKIW